MHLPGPVHEGQPDDRLTDEAPVATGAVDVGGENPADALRIVRRQRREGQIVIGQDPHDVTYARPAPHRDQPTLHVGRHEAGEVIQRHQDPVRHDTLVERMTAAEDPQAARALHQGDDLGLARRALVLAWRVAVTTDPVTEDASPHAALQPEEPLARRQIADDIERRGTDDLDIACEPHTERRPGRSISDDLGSLAWRGSASPSAVEGKFLGGWRRSGACIARPTREGCRVATRPRRT